MVGYAHKVLSYAMLPASMHARFMLKLWIQGTFGKGCAFISISAQNWPKNEHFSLVLVEDLTESRLSNTDGKSKETCIH